MRDRAVESKFSAVVTPNTAARRDPGTAIPLPDHSAHVLALQRAAGNAAVAQMLQRHGACDCGGNCDHCQEEDERLLATQGTSVLARQQSETETQCRVDVRATDPPIPVFGKHLFIVYRNEHGVETGYRAGPNVIGGVFAELEGDIGRYEEGLFPDYDPAAPTVTALSGSAACGKGDLLADALDDVNRAKIPYVHLGPNSNSVVNHLLHMCGIPRVKPDVVAIGWDVPLFKFSGSTSGAEGAGPEAPKGHEGAGGAPG